MIDLYERGSRKFDWWMDWRGECVAIVGSGPSVTKADVEKLRERIHVVVVNDNYKICPWADVLYSCEARWWNVNMEGLKTFPGLKIAWEVNSTLKSLGVNYIEIAKDKRSNYIYEFLLDEPGVVGSGGHSGFQAMNIVAQFGATGIGLLGFDLRKIRGELHWHGNHQSPLLNPDEGRFLEWKRWMELSAPTLLRNGIDVVNCSEVSAIDAFPKMSVERMLERWSL